MLATSDRTSEEVIGLEVKAAKITSRALALSMRMYLNKKSNPRGKMSVKQLMGKDAALKSIEITDSNIKSFEHVARKYGIDFALKKDKTQEPPKYIVFFKARDADVMNHAFKEYTDEVLGKEKNKSKDNSQHKQGRESVRDRLKQFKDKLKDKNRQRERTRTRTRDNII